MQGECSLGQSHPCLLGVFLLSQVQMAVTVELSGHGQVGRKSICPVVFVPLTSLPRAFAAAPGRAAGSALHDPEHRRVKNRASVPLSMTIMVAAELWAEMKSVSLPGR